MKRLRAIVAASALAATMLATAHADAAECEPRSSCFGLESVSAAISTDQAGAHPDLTLSFAVKQDPASKANVFGLHESYAPVRDVRIELPHGLTADPNMLGPSQQCTVAELAKALAAQCPNGSQVGLSKVSLYGLTATFTEPLYMMEPPGGDVVARLGMIAGLYPTFIDFKLRSEHQEDYGLTAEINDTSSNGSFVQVDTTTWGIPADPVHDTERCTVEEAFTGCTESVPRPPGSRALSFVTNPTNCEETEEIRVAVDSWVEPGRFVGMGSALPPISGCDRLPFDPSLAVEPTSHRAAAPTGLELSFRLPAPVGVGVRESSQLKDIRIDFPPGMDINTASAEGLETCSGEEVGFGTAEPSHCPDAAKLGDTEFDIPALPRRMKGSIYLRQPEPGHLFRIWVVADDLGAHVKLPGELEVDESTGQIHSVVLDLPQVPVREVRLLLKSGFRAPLVNPPACRTYQTHWEFTPWARPEEPVGGDTPMRIDENCGTGGFSPKLSAGSTNPTGGKHAPFVFSLTREDGEQNPASLDVTLAPGIGATFSGIPRCEGLAAETGACPAASQVGRVLAATGAGPTPLWTPEPGKRPTAVYLGGPYEGAPLSAIAVVPAQAGPFDLGDIVVRSAIFVDRETARATVKSDPLPQLIQGVPVLYRVTEVILDRPNFTLNPTNCSPESVEATVHSTQGAVAHPSAYFQASGCSQLPFKPSLAFHLFGATHRGGHPRLKAVLKMPRGDANIAAASAALPASELIDQGNFDNVCTRVQFAAHECPAGSVYGHAVAKSRLFDETLEGPVYLRSSSHNLPDVVAALKGPPSLPLEIDVDGRVDSVHGGVRTSFEAVPDSPVSSFVITLAGGAKKGLFENEEELCAHTNRATAKFTGQNGKKLVLHPVVQPSCRRGRHKRHRSG